MMLKNKFKFLHILILSFIIISFAFGAKILNHLPPEVKAGVTKAALTSPNPSAASTISAADDNQKHMTPKANDNKENSSIPVTEKSNPVISKDVQTSNQTESQANVGNSAQKPANEPSNDTNTDKPVVSTAVQSAVESKASTIVSKPVSSDDFMTAASAVLGKLSVTDMMYIFNSARDDFWVVTPVEEIKNIRNILFSKLTDEDLSVLQQLGKKYGRSMSILQKDLDVEKAKAKQVALHTTTGK